MQSRKHLVFLGSSSESKWLAREIEGCFRGFENIEVDAWYHFGSWPSGSSTLESLESRLRECDFAVLVLSEDDWTQSRGAPARLAPRDNVVFELGLFMGRLGRDRAFFFFPTAHDFKLPSDLFGITAFPYEISDREKAQRVVSPNCTRIVSQIEKVVRQHRVQGMQARPKLELRVKFPSDNGKTVDYLNHVSTSGVTIIEVRASIDDDNIDDFRIYFEPSLNLRKSSWTYTEDLHGSYYWASEMQLDEMKRGGGFLKFDADHPKRGRHQIRLIAMINDQLTYDKRFVIDVD